MRSNVVGYGHGFPTVSTHSKGPAISAWRRSHALSSEYLYLGWRNPSTRDASGHHSIHLQVSKAQNREGSKLKYAAPVYLSFNQWTRMLTTSPPAPPWCTMISVTIMTPEILVPLALSRATIGHSSRFSGTCRFMIVSISCRRHTANVNYL